MSDIAQNRAITLIGSAFSFRKQPSDDASEHPPLLFLLLLSAGCDNDDATGEEPPSLGKLIKLGDPPMGLSATHRVAEFQSMIYNDGALFVATNDGVWKCDIETQQWSRSGLEGLGLTALYKHPFEANKFFAGVHSNLVPTQKTFHYSTDGGMSWVSAESSPFDSLDNKFEDVVCFAAREGHPNQIYAGLGGPSFAVSTDGGVSWVRQDGISESYFGYPQNIAFRPGDSDRLYIGSENPLDYAWVGYSTIGDSPTNLSEAVQIVDLSVLRNRRPTELATFPNTGDALYIGHEGAISRISGEDDTFEFLIERTDGGQEDYPYIYALWVDPENSEHLLFGGQENGGEDMRLYETYNSGQTVTRFTDKLGFKIPIVTEIVTTPSHPAILISDETENRFGVWLYDWE